MVRCMLKERKIPKEFWGDAVACAVYLLNRFPTKRIGNVTPEEAWSLQKPRVDHLRIFGSVAFAKIPEEKRTKLEDKSQKCILLGYPENSSGYKLYNPITNKVVMSRDVEFDEQQIWNWKSDEQHKKAIASEEDDTIQASTEMALPESSPRSTRSHDSRSPIIRRTRPIQDLYDVTRRIDTNNDKLSLFCLFA